MCLTHVSDKPFYYGKHFFYEFSLLFNFIVVYV